MPFSIAALFPTRPPRIAIASKFFSLSGSLLCLGAGMWFGAISARAQSFTTLHTFTDTVQPDFPNPLIQGSDGGFYGTTELGGPSSFGTVFKQASDGAFSTLYTFTDGIDGAYPIGALVEGPDGNFYGSTSAGDGTIFQVTPAGVFTTLYTFTGATDGAEPGGPLIVGIDGDLYGDTQFGGANSGGTIFKITTAGVFTVIYQLPAAGDGDDVAGILMGKDGTIYGSLEVGGPDSLGEIYGISPAGVLSSIFTFTGGPEGGEPGGDSSMVLGPDSNIYGTAESGGADSNGTVFEVTPAGDETTLYTFTGAEGYSASTGISFGSDGNIYGVGIGDMSLTGAGYGAVFNVNPDGAFTTLYSFANGADGSYPVGTLAQGKDGAYYGATDGDGSTTFGSLFRFMPALVVSPAVVVGGHSSVGTVTLTAPATAATVVLLNSNTPGAATTPTSVTVPAGASSATFSISTSAVTADTGVTVSETLGGVTQTAALDVIASPPPLSSVAVSPSTVNSGLAATGTVTLAGPAPVGVVVMLASSNTAAATVPASVTIPAGSSTATFPVTTSVVAANATSTISGTIGGITKTALLHVNYVPLAVAAVTVSPYAVTGGAGSTGTVTLTTVSSAAVTVALTSSNAAATVPFKVVVPAGSKTATFAIGTMAVTANASAIIAATYGAVSKTATLTVDAAVVTSLGITPSIVQGGAPSVGTVYLSGPAVSAGLVVTLSSASPSVVVPASVKAPSGNKTVVFTITTTSVAAATAVVITATEGGVSVSNTLHLSPPAVRSLLVNPYALTGGVANSTGTVAITEPAPSGGYAVALTSSDSAAATVPATVTIPAGSKSTAFPITTSVVAASVKVTLTAAAGGVDTMAILTVNAPVLSSMGVTPSTVVGGKTSTGSVYLMGSAPAGGITVKLTSGNKAVTLPGSVVVAAGTKSQTFTITSTAVTSATVVQLTATSGSAEVTNVIHVNP